MIQHLLRARLITAALLIAVSHQAFAIKFVQREFKYNVPAKGQVSLDLRTVVKEVAAVDQIRFVVHNQPSWLGYDAGNFRLAGSPPAGTTPVNRFGVEVFQGATSDFSFIEYTVFSAPKWVKPVIDLGAQWEGRPYTLDLKTLVENRNARALSFSATGLPRWMSLTADGLLSGLPARTDVGNYNGIVLRVDGPFSTYSTAGASGQVQRVPSAPKWTKDAIGLEDGVEDLLYERVLAEFVSNPDGVPLSFALVPGKYPPWINITSQGKLFGVPRRKDVGPASVTVKLTALVAGQPQTETVTFTFQILRTNKAPFWKEDPVLLAKALQNNPYLSDLSSFVDDPDLAEGDGLFLEIVNGPTWASLAPPALLRGTPPPNALGTQTWKIRVSDVGGLSAVATVMLDIVKANKPPVLQSGLSFTLKERQTLSQDLSKYATDAEGDLIFFEPLNFPSWVTLDGAGRLEVKPTHSDLGQHSLQVRLGDGNSKVTASFQVIVQADPRPPVWLEDPIRIDAVSGVAFALSIADKVQDLDGQALNFSKVSGPDWMAIDTVGRLGGLAKESDAGEFRFVVSAKNDVGDSEATVIVNVAQGNRPPQWTQDPIVLTPAKFDVSYTFDLSRFATDADGDTLRFTKVFAPWWLRLTTDGTIGGTPSSADQGEFTAVFEVTDGKVTAQVGAVGRVGNGNQPPVIKSGALSFAVKAKATFTEELGQTKYVEDPDGGTLQFSGLSLPGWVTLSAAGTLRLSPTVQQVGSHNFNFSVTDGTTPVQGVIQVRVSNDPRPPIWLEDPVNFGALVNQAFTASLVDKVQDLEGLPITYAKVSGPAWLAVSSTGTVSGVPGSGNSGVNNFVVSATSGNGTVNGTVKVTVRTSLTLYRVPVENGGDDPAMEVLWAIDNSGSTSAYLPSLYSAVKGFYSGLETAKVRHASGLVSTRDWNGRLVADADGNSLLTGDPSALAQDFQERVERVYTGQSFNSPIWSLSRLYDVVTTSQTPMKGYWSDGIPMEVFILTASGDSYKQLAQGTPKATFQVADYQQGYTKFHDRSEQPFTVTVYDMRCPSVVDNSNPANQPDYLNLAHGTLGTYYHQGDTCEDRVWGAVLGFQKEALFRAKVYSRRRLKLTNPAVVKTLRVQLRHGTMITLPGNTGASDDAWHYDSKTQEVVMHWQKIHVRVQSGDEIEILY